MLAASLRVARRWVGFNHARVRPSAADRSRGTRSTRIQLGVPVQRPNADRLPSPTPRARSLVPRGAVSLTVCRYNGLPGDPRSVHGVAAHKLVAAGTTGNSSMIAKVTTELDAIRPTRPGVSYGCPADFGTKLLAFFVYPSRRGDVVTIDLSGCNTITNGHVRRLGRNAPVIGQLTGLAARLVATRSSPGLAALCRLGSPRATGLRGRVKRCRAARRSRPAIDRDVARLR